MKKSELTKIIREELLLEQLYKEVKTYNNKGSNITIHGMDPAYAKNTSIYLLDTLLRSPELSPFKGKGIDVIIKIRD
tara:strand:- start:64 stop:294 length:231 start_codon:yes stop_codon:yes gene_type:complete